jgi:hypothetical protein
MAPGGGYRLSQDWDPLIVSSAQQNGISPNLLRGVLWQESNFNPKITGPMTKYGTAKGIAQLTDDTAQELAVTDPYDPQQAIPAAARYLAKYRQVGVDKGAANPDAYAAMVYYGGPGFKATNRPAPGVPGPDVQGYATSVLNHAVNFSNLAGGAAPSTAQLGPPAGSSQPVAGPLAPGAPSGLQPTSGPLPTNWADVPGAPASMRVAPPSMFTASSPEEQALYERVSTPQGYEAAVRALAGAGTASPAGRVTEDPSRSVPTVLPPLNLAAPSQVTEDPARSVATVLPPALQRALTDEAIGKMGPEDVFGVVMNENLTDADRSALNDRLAELQRQLSSSGGQ